MFDYNFDSKKTGQPGALEVAMHARDAEKKQALQFAEYKIDSGIENRRSRGLLANLLAALRIF